MPFNPCIVIPCFNHGSEILKTLQRLKQFDLLCIVVDDGSELETRDKLEQINKTEPWVTVHYKTENSGKGGAVIKGMELASSMDYSHCLQIDADGQHDVADIPTMLLQSKDNLESVVCGQPVYDESVSMGRYISRYITHFWVGIEILSLHPPDTMCGFRVYPLAKTLSIIESVPIGKRMDFDIEILVRLIWEKVPVIRVPTRVIYLQDGLSNFHYFKDNVLISLMHTRLVLTMLVRLPLNLVNRLFGGSGKHWSNISERGSKSGIKFLLWVYQKLGRSIFEFFLYFVIAYFFSTNKSTRHASLEFLDKAHRAGSSHPDLQQKPTLKTSFSHFMEFGRSALDRVASWMGDIKREDLVFDNSHEFDDLAARGSGGIIIGSHLGNIEVCRALADGREGRILNVLVFTEHARKFNQVIKKVNPNFVDRVIQVNQLGPDTAIMLKQKIDAGEIIVIVGDRTAVNSVGRTRQVDFLGYPASFSEGPFILASLMECPVYLMFCLMEDEQYHVYLEHFSDKISLPRKTRDIDIQHVIQRYTHRLEYYCLQQPFQWFNFYDFWGEPQSKAGDV